MLDIFLNLFSLELGHAMYQSIGKWGQHGISWSLAGQPECKKLFLHLKINFLVPFMYFFICISHDKIDLKDLHGSSWLLARRAECLKP